MQSVLQFPLYFLTQSTNHSIYRVFQELHVSFPSKIFYCHWCIIWFPLWGDSFGGKIKNIIFSSYYKYKIISDNALLPYALKMLMPVSKWLLSDVALTDLNWVAQTSIKLIVN